MAHTFNTEGYLHGLQDRLHANDNQLLSLLHRSSNVVAHRAAGALEASPEEPAHPGLYQPPACELPELPAERAYDVRSPEESEPYYSDEAPAGFDSEWDEADVVRVASAIMRKADGFVPNGELTMTELFACLANSEYERFAAWMTDMEHFYMHDIDFNGRIDFDELCLAVRDYLTEVAPLSPQPLSSEPELSPEPSGVGHKTALAEAEPSVSPEVEKSLQASHKIFAEVRRRVGDAMNNPSALHVRNPLGVLQPSQPTSYGLQLTYKEYVSLLAKRAESSATERSSHPVREHSNNPISMQPEPQIKVRTYPAKANVCLSWCVDTTNPPKQVRKWGHAELPERKAPLPRKSLGDFERKENSQPAWNKY